MQSADWRPRFEIPRGRFNPMSSSRVRNWCGHVVYTTLESRALIARFDTVRRRRCTEKTSWELDATVDSSLEKQVAVRAGSEPARAVKNFWNCFRGTCGNTVPKRCAQDLHALTSATFREDIYKLVFVAPSADKWWGIRRRAWGTCEGTWFCGLLRVFLWCFSIAREPEVRLLFCKVCWVMRSDYPGNSSRFGANEEFYCVRRSSFFSTGVYRV